MTWAKTGNIKGPAGAATLSTIAASGSGTTVVNTATETAVLSCTIPANTLGANGAVTIRLGGRYLNNSGSTAALQIKVTYGGTVLYQGTTAAQTANATAHVLDCNLVLAGTGATNAQTLFGVPIMSTPAAGTTGLGSIAAVPANATGIVSAIRGVSSVDSTADQTLTVTVKLAAANAALAFYADYYTVNIVGGTAGPQGPKGDTGAPISGATGIAVVSTLPGTPDPNTVYIVTT